MATTLVKPLHRPKSISRPKPPSEPTGGKFEVLPPLPTNRPAPPTDPTTGRPYVTTPHSKHPKPTRPTPVPVKQYPRPKSTPRPTRSLPHRA